MIQNFFRLGLDLSHVYNNKYNIQDDFEEAIKGLVSLSKDSMFVLSSENSKYIYPDDDSGIHEMVSVYRWSRYYIKKEYIDKSTFPVAALKKLTIEVSPYDHDYRFLFTDGSELTSEEFQEKLISLEENDFWVDDNPDHDKELVRKFKKHISNDNK